MATIEQLTSNLIDAGDNLYLDNQGNWQTTTPAGDIVPNQWAWGDNGLIPLGGSTVHENTPFLEIMEQYRGGNPIDAETWQEAARSSIEGFMRTVHTPPPEGTDIVLPGRSVEPDYLFDSEVSGQMGSQFRLGTLMELMQDPTIAGTFTDTPAARDALNFLTQEQINQLSAPSDQVFERGEDVGMTNSMGFRRPFRTDRMGAGLADVIGRLGAKAGQGIGVEQWESLTPEQQGRFMAAVPGFNAPYSDRQGIDPLLGLNPSDKLLTFEDIPTGMDLEKMFGPLADFITKGTDQDFNDYIFKLNLDKYAPPPEVMQASPESVLQKMFDLPQYRLAFGNEPEVLDPTASPTERFRADPGYQFAQDEGMRNIQRNAASKGLLESGKTMRDLQTFGQGLADQNYSRFQGQNMGIYSDWQNQLRGLASQGANLSSQASNQAMGAGGSLAGLNTQLASNLGSLFGNQGVLGASAFMNTGAASANMSMQAASLQAQIAAANAAAQGGGGGGGGGGGFDIGGAISALGGLF